jgi:hypothetical protein
MSITRRQFLLGTSAGLILPSYFDKAQNYFANRGEPLLIAPKRTVETLYADMNRYDGSFSLNLGDDVQLPSMTIAEFAEWQCGSREEYLWDWCGEDPDEVGIDSIDWDEETDPVLIAECWPTDDIPCVKAYNLLSELDLGPQLEGAQAVGELRFSGGSPGGNVSGVYATDAVTLTLLQHRLNELGENTRIELV